MFLNMVKVVGKCKVPEIRRPHQDIEHKKKQFKLLETLREIKEVKS